SIFRVGTSATLLQNADQKLVGSFEFSHPPDNSERVNVGAEYAFHKYVFLRGGYAFNYDAEGVAGGVGFHFPVSVAGMADLGYAYTDMLDLGAAHRFSLRFQFSSAARARGRRSKPCKLSIRTPAHARRRAPPGGRAGAFCGWSWRWDSQPPAPRSRQRPSAPRGRRRGGRGA